jgi:hypothetical protein
MPHIQDRSGIERFYTTQKLGFLIKAHHELARERELASDGLIDEGGINWYLRTLLNLGESSEKDSKRRRLVRELLELRGDFSVKDGEDQDLVEGVDVE